MKKVIAIIALSEAIMKHPRSPFYVFIDYSGHVNKLTIRITTRTNFYVQVFSESVYLRPQRKTVTALNKCYNELLRLYKEITGSEEFDNWNSYYVQLLEKEKEKLHTKN